MNIDQITQTLFSAKNNFPLEAVQAAQKEQEAMSPIFIDELNKIIADPKRVENKGDDYLFHLYALFFLASWQETSAFPLLIDIISGEKEDCEVMLGDSITEDLPTILASLFDGHIESLEAVFKNRTLDDYVRLAAAECLLALLAQNKITEAYAKTHFKAWFEFGLAHEGQYSDLLSCMVCSACDQEYRELLPLIEQAYQQDLIDDTFTSLEEVKAALSEQAVAPYLYLESRYKPITNVVSSMSWWAYFNQQDNKNHDCDTDDEYAFNTLTEPVSAPPKIGRNEPCPCGSGKKYKKCCLL